MDDEQEVLSGVARDLDGDDLQLAVAFVWPDVAPSGVALAGRRTGCSRMSHDVAHGTATDPVLAGSLGEADLHPAIVSDKTTDVDGDVSRDHRLATVLLKNRRPVTDR